MTEPAIKKQILFVDDENSILEGLQRLLRPYRNEWNMIFAHSGKEALGVMEKTPFDVVITDMRMPEMDGATLLGNVMKLYPETIRFILSGHSDQELIYRSLGATHQYMAKPCEADMLINTISRAFALRSILRKDSLKKLVTQIKVIPSLPDLYLQVVGELKSPNASIQKVGELISKDIGMSAKILQLVNSAFFGLRHRVTNPAQAVSLLGMDVLKSLILVAHVFSQLDRSGLEDLSIDALWQHSMLVGHCAQAIVKKENVEKKTADDAFMAGLFHDIGKLVLAVNLPLQYRKVMALARDKYVPYLDAEIQVFEATHADVGAYLLGLWGFGDPVIEACAFHHQPSLCVGSKFSSLTAVHIANVYDSQQKHPPLLAANRLDEAYLERLGLKDRWPEWEATCQTVRDQGERLHAKDTVSG
ncbi:MAG: response regulator [Lentisphaerota bacterium]